MGSGVRSQGGVQGMQGQGRGGRVRWGMDFGLGRSRG